jgi:hypothetical protein
MESAVSASVRPTRLVDLERIDYCRRILIKGERTQFRNDVNTLLGELVEGTVRAPPVFNQAVVYLRCKHTIRVNKLRTFSFKF